MVYLIHRSTVIACFTPFLCYFCFAFYVVLFLLGSIEMFSSVKEVLGYLSLFEIVVVVSVTCLKLEKGEGKKVI